MAPTGHRVVLGGVACPVLVTAYYRALGFGVAVTDPVPAASYVLVLAAFGVLFAVAARERLWGTAGFAAVLLVSLPLVVGRPGPGGGEPLPVYHLWNELAVLLVLPVLLASVEYPLLHPDAAGRAVTRRSLRVALAVGTGHALLVVALWTYFFLVPWEQLLLFAATQLVWMAGGALYLAGVPVLLAVRLRLVTPVAVVTGWFAWSAGATWVTLGAGRPVDWLLTATPFETYVVHWFVPLGVALAAGGSEYLLRTRLRVSPPRIDTRL